MDMRFDPIFWGLMAVGAAAAIAYGLLFLTGRQAGRARS
jgi:hypothetical protein